MLQTTTTQTPSSNPEQAISSALTSIDAQISQGASRLRLDNQTEQSISDSVKKLLNLPDGATVKVIPDYLTDKSGRPVAPILYGTLLIPKPDGTNVRLAYGINDQNSIFIGTELTGNRTMKVDDLDRGINLSFNDAKEALPLIMEGAKASGPQIPVLRNNNGDILLMDSDTVLVPNTARNLRNFTDDFLKKIHIAYRNENDDIVVENPTSGKRTPVETRTKNGVVTVNFKVEFSLGKNTFELLLDNFGRMGSFGNQHDDSHSKKEDSDSTDRDNVGNNQELTKNEEP